MSTGVWFEHPYSGNEVQLDRVVFLSGNKIRIWFKAKGQRGCFTVRINNDGTSTPKVSAAVIMEVQTCHT